MGLKLINVPKIMCLIIRAEQKVQIKRAKNANKSANKYTENANKNAKSANKYAENATKNSK